MRLIAISLDQEAAGQLEVAIRHYRKVLRRKGYRAAPGLVHLHALAVGIGQQTPRYATSLTSACDRLHDPAHEVLSHSEVADQLGVSVRSVQRMLDRGELGWVDIGGKRKVRRVDLDSFGARNAGDHGDQRDEPDPPDRARPASPSPEDT